MAEIIAYFNTILNAIFNQAGTSYKLELLRSSQVIGSLKAAFDTVSATSPFDPLHFLFSILSDASLTFSLFVWTWFAILIIKLSLIYPFKWFKSLVKRK